MLLWCCGFSFTCTAHLDWLGPFLHDYRIEQQTATATIAGQDRSLLGGIACV